MMINAATQFLDDKAKFGGELTKAKFVCYPGKGEDLLGGEQFEVPFYVNPNTISTSKEVQFEEDAGTQKTIAIKYHQTNPLCLNIGELWFDTYDTRQSVREVYVDLLEDLCNYMSETHYPPIVVFHFGEFSQATKHKHDYYFFVCKLDTEYSMFLPDGTPVRAKCSVCLKQYCPPSLEEQNRDKRSPDHARTYTIKRGDTLQSIAFFAYDDPREWRRIADSNRIEDPMFLKPGKVLMLPPILG